MTTARVQQISLADTPYYHIISRCVRHTYLCGTDKLTEGNLGHAPNVAWPPILVSSNSRRGNNLL